MPSPTLNSLSLSMKVVVSGNAQVTVVGNDYTDPNRPLSITKNIGPFTTAQANTAPLGANEAYSAITTIASSAAADISLQNLTDLLLQSGLSFARVKGYVVRLLSVADDATNGTSCTGITINGTGTNLATLPGLTNVTLGNGEFIAWATPSASGQAVTGTTNDLHIVNNDAAHAAAVQITLVGGTS